MFKAAVNRFWPFASINGEELEKMVIDSYLKGREHGAHNVNILDEIENVRFGKTSVILLMIAGVDPRTDTDFKLFLCDKLLVALSNQMDKKSAWEIVGLFHPYNVIGPTSRYGTKSTISYIRDILNSAAFHCGKTYPIRYKVKIETKRDDISFTTFHSSMSGAEEFTEFLLNLWNK